MERVVLVAPGDASEALKRFTTFLKAGPAVMERMREGMLARHGLPIEAVAAATLGAGATVPALVIHDAHDTDAPPEDGKAYYHHWAGPVEWLETEGLGHRRILRDPVVAGAIAAFLTRDLRRAAS